MSAKPPLYRSDIKPLEFTIAVTVGGIGSAVLSSLRVSPLVSVGFALGVMLVLAFLRWRIACEFKDYESLEAFAEDIYLLGYLLTLAALLGLAPRLMADEANLFSIAGLKLVTTVVGLALMMIFRQTARRWAEEEESSAVEKFREQQRLFSDAVTRLNEGADALTKKLDEVVRRFDPGLLVPVAEWSKRAAGAFGSATQALELVPAAVEGSRKSLGGLNSDLEKAGTAASAMAEVFTRDTVRAAGALAGGLTDASRAAGRLGDIVTAIQPAAEAARVSLEKVGNEASLGVTRFAEISTSLGLVAVEIGKVKDVLKEITEVKASDVNAPINRLVAALDVSATKTTTSAERMDAMNDELQSSTAASKGLAKAMGEEVAEHRRAVEAVQQGVARVEEQLVRVSQELATAVDVCQPGVDASAQLIAQVRELLAQTNEANSQMREFLRRAPDGAGSDGRGGFWPWKWGK